MTASSDSSKAVGQAQSILDGHSPVPEFGALKALVKSLKSGLEFGVARKLIARTRGRYKPEEETWLTQQLALCTYKDEDRLPRPRFDEALALLESIGLRDATNIDPETLALGGAVYKRKWEHGGQLEHLHESLAFYSAAWERNPGKDMGYGAVNAAFALDLLAARARTIARRSRTEPALALAQAERAAKIRSEVVARLEGELARDARQGDQDWFAVTLAEAHFGLGNHEAAGRWLAKARDLGPSEWEQQTTFKQFVAIARAQGIEVPAKKSDPERWHPAWKALRRFLAESTASALSCYRGKVGLGLSGGGFRASLFHIGVLARLAEAGVLGSVEALSTVSGGSIVGAHYYLEVRKLLESVPDADIGREHYIGIVKRIEEEFLAGVRMNLRTRALTNLFYNAMMVLGHYSRSHRMGELYEKFLYSRVKDGHWDGAPRRLRDLIIRPATGAPAAGAGQAQDTGFKPRFSNWRRDAKVPVLLLNATSLNTGHSWHFTARWMGEPPGLVDGDVDVNERYRRLWYDQAPIDALRQYPLGYAVAASACVPGLFDPLALKGLYPGRVVRLVDGGVHDNQGVDGLLNEGCTLILCSDASGQMEDQRKPSDTALGVPLRSNSILMDRVREAEYQDLSARVENRALEGLFFIHLKKGLATEPIDWIDCDDPTVPEATPASATDYGVDKDLQYKLAAIRTDLDSFTEVEAYALMASGYLMTEHELKELDRRHRQDGLAGTWGGFDVDAARGEWQFLALEPILRRPPRSSDLRREDLGRQLEVGASLFFKIWKLSRALRMFAYTAAAVAAIALACFVRDNLHTQIGFSATVGAVVLVVLLAAAAVVVPAVKWLDPQRAVRGYVWKAVGAVAGCVFTNVHLWIFDPMFLRRGKLKRLMKLPAE